MPENVPRPLGPRTRFFLWLGGGVLLFGLVWLGRELVIRRALSRIGAAARVLGEASQSGLPGSKAELGPTDALLWLLEPVTEGSTESQAPAPMQEVVRPSAVPRLGPEPAPVVVLKSQVVLGLAERGAMPRGVVRSAAGDLPAGIEILEGSGLGIGWFPGDRLILVDGVPVLDRSQVIREVLARRARREPMITATVARQTRGGVVNYRVLVEQPYLAQTQADEAGAPGPEVAPAP